MTTTRQQRLMRIVRVYGHCQANKFYTIDGKQERLTTKDFRSLGAFIKSNKDLVDISRGHIWHVRDKDFIIKAVMNEDDVITVSKKGKRLTVRQVKFLIERFKLKAQAGYTTKQKRAYYWRQHFRMKELLDDYRREREREAAAARGSSEGDGGQKDVDQ